MHWFSCAAAVTTAELELIYIGDTLIKKMCIFHDILQIGLQGLQAQNTFEKNLKLWQSPKGGVGKECQCHNFH